MAHPNPALYRPCAGIALLNKDNHLFMGKRLDSSAEAWQMPQGGIDDGETPEQALWREMMEEIGTTHGQLEYTIPDWLYYDLPDALQGRLWGGAYKGQRQKWFIVRFTGHDSDINITTPHPEFISWQWVAPEQVMDLIVPFKRDVYTIVLEHLRRHLQA